MPERQRVLGWGVTMRMVLGAIGAVMRGVWPDEAAWPPLVRCPACDASPRTHSQPLSMGEGTVHTLAHDCPANAFARDDLDPRALAEAWTLQCGALRTDGSER